MSRATKIALYILFAAAIMAGCIVLFTFNPEDVGFYPRCPSKMLTGYDCPGCGSLRGLHSLLHGDFAAAWRYNPAIFVAIFLLILIGIAGIHRRKSIAVHVSPGIVRFSRKTSRIVDHPVFPIILLAAIFVWTIVRNL